MNNRFAEKRRRYLREYRDGIYTGMLLTGKLDGAYIETDVAKSYAQNYPDLAIILDVPYESEGSAVGVCKDNAELLAAVNEAIAAAKADGSLENFIAEAQELAAGETYEGLLDENGQAQ